MDPTQSTKDHLTLFDTSSASFGNKDYILKLNNMHNLKFFRDELTIKYVGKGYNLIDYASAQSSRPINNMNPIFYFEVNIVDYGSKRDITVGLSDKEFILNKQCGTTSKSFGYNCDGKIYHDKQKGDNYGPKFRESDVVGCGYYFSKNAIFYTLNGKFLDWAFKDVEFHNYYATVSLHSLNEKVTVNFGAKNFLFDIEGFYVAQTQEKLETVMREPIELGDLDYIMREYLVHSGYQESFVALDQENVSNGIVKPAEDGFDEDEVADLQFFKNESMKESERMDIEESAIDPEKLRKYSADDEILKEPGLRKRTLSLMIDRMNGKRKVILEEDQANGEKKSKVPDSFVLMNFLKERKILQNMLFERDFDTALSYFESTFQPHATKKETNFRRIVLCLTTMKYLELLKANEYMAAYQLFNGLDKAYWSREIVVSLYDAKQKVVDYTLESLAVLLCYENIANTEFAHFFADCQLNVISDQINGLILEIAGVSRESVLEKISKQQWLVEHLYKTVKNCPGDNITIKL